MKKILSNLSFTLALVFVSTLAFAQDVLVDVNKSYPGIKTIEVQGGWLDVSYQGGSSGDVQVEAYLQSEDENQDIIFVTLGDVLKISYERSNRNMSWNTNRSKGWIKISGPENMDMEIKNSSGNLMVDRVTNDETTLKVTSGKISASKIGGDLNIGATSGNLIVDGVKGSIDAGLTSGNADIKNVSGDLDYQSTSGSLTAENVDGELSVNLTSGNARLYHIGQLGRLRFTSGNIRAEDAGLGPNTSFSGTSGNFRVQTNSDLKAYNFELKASSGNLKVGGISTGKTLEIDNGASDTIKGNISSGGITIDN